MTRGRGRDAAGCVIVGMLAGCISKPADMCCDFFDSASRETDADTDADSNADADTDPTEDTSPAPFLSAVVSTDGAGGFLEGRYGLRFLLPGYLPDLVSVCDDMGDIAAGVAPPCPACDWAFTFTVASSTAVGPSCAELGRADGDFTATTSGWGWADAFVYEGPYRSYTLTETAFYYFSGYAAWYPVAFTYDGGHYGGYTYGDAEASSFNLFDAPYYLYP